MLKIKSIEVKSTQATCVIIKFCCIIKGPLTAFAKSEIICLGRS